ncbi:MAG TPA: ribonuclease HI family protein [Aquificaceae bacterium]|nr:ribonuclease HI family protein [Aquificaceae bacterium]HIQ48047.1 ribonuclease HI family protein [Aquifex aeolicus]
MIERAFVIPFEYLAELSNKKSKEDILKLLEPLKSKVEVLLIKKDGDYTELRTKEDIESFLENLKSSTAVMYFDGASAGNPGRAGIGIVIILPGKKIKISKCIGKATSNEAEYKALIEGLRKAKELGVKNLVVRGDSQLVINQVTGKYRVKNERLKDLYNQVKELEKFFNSIYYEKIPREWNKKADYLSKKATL